MHMQLRAPMYSTTCSNLYSYVIYMYRTFSWEKSGTRLKGNRVQPEKCRTMMVGIGWGMLIQQ